MLRHHEVQVLFVILLLLSLVFVAVGWLVSPQAATLAASVSASLCLVFWLFTVNRYRKISQLSAYLKRISAGEHSLDIRDNTEGELSILKSEIYKVTLMLSEYNQQLQQEKLLLSDTVADISHQLKTPLTSMLMMVGFLRDDELPINKRREFNAHLRSQLERIEWLVSALLKMSRLDAGVVEMKTTAVSAQILLDNALRPLLIPLELKEIDCSVNAKETIINCDMQWTTEAIINILKNCIEHTPRGGRIVLSAEDNPLYAEITIADNGAGIERQDLPHIFARFYRGKNSSSDSIGIGLAMSKTIIRKQHGDITVDSRPGQGSTFYVRFYKSVL